MRLSRLERVFLLAAGLAVVATAGFGVGVYHALHDTPALTAVNGPGSDSGASARVSTVTGTSAPGAGASGSARPGSRGGQVAAGQPGAGAATLAPTVCPFPGGTMTVGSIVSLNGFFQFPQAANAAKAYFQDANAHGGIHGCRVSDEVLDDGTDPSTALTDAKRLVADDHVLSIVSASKSFPFGAATVRTGYHRPGRGTGPVLWGMSTREPDLWHRGRDLLPGFYRHGRGTRLGSFAGRGGPW